MLRFRTDQIELNNVAKHLFELYGIPSRAQGKWSEIVFDGSLPYTPDTVSTGGRGRDLQGASRTASEELFELGEIKYTSGTTPDFAHFFWIGNVMVDRKTGSAWARRGTTKRYRIPNQELEFHVNTNATSFRTLNAASSFGKKWVEDFQEWINKGGN